MPRRSRIAFDDIHVRALVAGADVVDLAGRALVQEEVERLTVVLDEKPVADLAAVAVDGQRLVVHGVGDEQRRHLLRVLVRADVVARPGDDDGQALGFDEGVALHVAAGLARGVGAARTQQVALFRAMGRRDFTVDLVGGDVEHAFDASTGFGDGGEQAVGAVDVGLDEGRRFQERTVDVALGGEVDDGIDLGDELS